MMKKSEILDDFLSYLEEVPIVYVLDESIYHLLKNNVNVEMVYLKGGIFYDPLLRPLENNWVIVEDSIYEIFHKYNHQLDMGEVNDMNVFANAYKFTDQKGGIELLC